MVTNYSLIANVVCGTNIIKFNLSFKKDSLLPEPDTNALAAFKEKGTKIDCLNKYYH